MDDYVNNFKNSLPPHIQVIVGDSHLLLSNDRYPLTIIEIPCTLPLPTNTEIESRFEQLNRDQVNTEQFNTEQVNTGPGIVNPPSDGSCLFPTDNLFGPVKPTADWYFNPESSLFSREYTIDRRSSKATIDKMRFPPGARIYPMSPVKQPSGGKPVLREFYTLDPDSDPDPEPEYPFGDRDL